MSKQKRDVSKATLKLYFEIDETGIKKGCIEMINPLAVMFFNIQRVGIAFTVGDNMSESAKAFFKPKEVYFVAVPDQVKAVMSFMDAEKYIGFGLVTPIWGDSRPFPVPENAQFKPLPGDAGRELMDLCRELKTTKMESFAI